MTSEMYLESGLLGGGNLCTDCGPRQGNRNDSGVIDGTLPDGPGEKTGTEGCPGQPDGDAVGELGRGVGVATRSLSADRSTD